MTKYRKNYILKFTVFFILIISNTLNLNFAKDNIKNSDKIMFWQSQRKGANIFNKNINTNDIKAAKEYGIEFIRLSPDKFLTSHRDFLIGNADNYHQLIKEDLKQLKSILDICYKEKMPVVITMLSLPGSRWKQNNNNNKDDLRIWKDKKYQTQSALFWQDLAAKLKDHPAIIGYNILNEPHPERIFMSKEVDITKVNQGKVQKILYDLYSQIIKHIRISDKDTPIILDSSAYADPQTFSFLIPHKDKKILYSFHMYEPYQYTNRKSNNGKFKYPGVINHKEWDKKSLRDYTSSVISFQKNNHIAPNQILVGEFGGHRMSQGLEKYFSDLIDIFNQEGWHFAFYAFREDVWDGMDYELGNKKVPWSYWQTIDRGETPIVERNNNYPAFTVIKKNLNPKN